MKRINGLNTDYVNLNYLVNLNVYAYGRNVSI